MSNNLFFYGNPVPPDQFLNRQRELRRITGRIVSRGQSTAIIGEPRSGKTSLLLYMAAPERRAKLYNTVGERLLFSYLDAQTLGGKFSQAQFWEYVLCPLYEQAVTPGPSSPLAQAYQICQENEFGCFVLERLFTQMDQAGWRLVLMLDEFDWLLYHPILNCAEFFGGLRSLASRNCALALVIASRSPLASLNDTTRQFSRASSPYFNFLSEITLGPLPDKDVAGLLRLAEDRFTAADRRFIVEVAGGHPYLVQATASALWEAYEDGERDPYRRRKQAGESLYDEAARTMSDTWRLWSPEMRKALTTVALAHIPYLLRQREFDVEYLLRGMRDFGPELRSLTKQGFIAKDDAIPGGWRAGPQAFLWWLADELVRTVRDATSFEEWLRAQEYEGMLTKGEKEQLSKAAQAIAGLLKDGVVTLIEAAAKGVGEAVMKGG